MNPVILSGVQLIKNISELPKTGQPVILAMGCFDGVHIGHQKVISTAVEEAKVINGEAWVYTFNPHPAKVLSPETAPPLISAPPCRMRQFEALGVHGVIEIPFDKTYAHIEPETFLSNLWKNLPSLAGIVCGIDWSFGYRASGKFQTLETFCSARNITATAVHPVLVDGERVSSTHIRNAVLEGSIPEAERLLGRPFSLFGTVIPGNSIGKELGYPTANIDPLNELLPGPGVYAAWTRLQKSGVRSQESDLSNPIPAPWSLSSEYASAVFIGKRETFGCHKHVIETHLLDFDGDLYGQNIEVVLASKTRNVYPFPSKEALIEQIAKDVDQVRNMFL